MLECQESTSLHSQHPSLKSMNAPLLKQSQLIGKGSTLNTFHLRLSLMVISFSLAENDTNFFTRILFCVSNSHLLKDILSVRITKCKNVHRYFNTVGLKTTRPNMKNFKAIMTYRDVTHPPS